MEATEVNTGRILQFVIGDEDLHRYTKQVISLLKDKELACALTKSNDTRLKSTLINLLDINPTDIKNMGPKFKQVATEQSNSVGIEILYEELLAEMGVYQEDRSLRVVQFLQDLSTESAGYSHALRLVLEVFFQHIANNRHLKGFSFVGESSR